MKAARRVPVFCPLDEWGAPIPAIGIAMVWVQAIAGIVPSVREFLGPVAVDAKSTVSVRSYAHVVTNAAQDVLAVGRQLAVVNAVANGLRDAASLDLAAAGDLAIVVPTGVVVRLPQQADAVTFFAYARDELTGVLSAALTRPLHPQARLHLTAAEKASSLHALERLMIVPVGPDFGDEEVGHSVLGIVKGAEYTGWRWVNDHARAAWYGAWLDQRYGPKHEAYRPAFVIS